MRPVWLGYWAAALLPVLAGCWSGAGHQVVVYTALDPEFSTQILQDFAQQTGIEALPKFDTEATKTVGLAHAIMAEAPRPRCDVFWNNEILNTLRLQEKGLLTAYISPAAASFPAAFKDPGGMWTGFAARARVLIVNTDRVPPSRRPASLEDLCDPRWQGQTGIAKPLFGTTATHTACLFAVLGHEQAKQFFLRLKENKVSVQAGNKQVALSVASGRLAFGLTDTDDALVMIDQGYPVTIVYPDQGPAGPGTLFIPNTLAIVKGCPHAPEARHLVDYLLEPATETRLARGPSGQIPLNPAVDVETRVATPHTVKAMQVDFREAAKHWDTAALFVRDHFFTAD